MVCRFQFYYRQMDFRLTVQLPRPRCSTSAPQVFNFAAPGVQSPRLNCSILRAVVIGADDLKWDLMMVDSEGTEIELYGLDFTECSTEGGTIVLEFDGTNGTATLYSE